MALSDLQAIRTKVRRLTRSPSTSQLSDIELDNYINTFILYDFPEHLRLFSLRTTFTFYTQPGVDTYETEDSNMSDAMYNFKNKYVAIHDPVYIAGVPAFFTQWRDVFYGYYPQTNSIQQTLLFGNGTTGVFTGTLTAKPIMQNNVIFSCLDNNDEAMILIDYPQDNTTGNLALVNDPTNVLGAIDYITGVYAFSFPNNTKNMAPIIATTIPYQPGKPIAMLYYDNKFTLRPIPDQVYAVQMEADVRPTELLESAQSPQLEQWWQYIAYGTAKKIFEDRMDLDSVQLIMPEFKQQERLVLRTTLTQQVNERTVTIYTQGKSYGWGWFGSNWPY